MGHGGNQGKGSFVKDNRRGLLVELFEAAVAAADPTVCLPPHLPSPPLGRTVVLGAGKAAGSMTRAVEQNWQGELEGLVVTQYGHAVPTSRIEVVQAAHPVPDAAGEAAAARILALAADLGPDDLLLVLISGGGSSLLSLPSPGLSLADKQAVNQALLRSGAPIDQMNVVRKHLSAIKGGQLAAAAAPARVVSLLISDVPGDDPAIIASGPTVADPSTFAQAREILANYHIDPPEAVARHLAAAEMETPKPGDPRLEACETALIARPAQSIAAAAEIAAAAGYQVELLGDDLEGEARELGAGHGEMALTRYRAGQRVALLSGGETTVTVRGKGRGGRNLEYLAGLALALGGNPGICAIACDTDGIDGTEDNAGAVVLPDTLIRAAAAGLDPGTLLADNDAYGLFHSLDDLVISGPTLTNVNDFRAILIDPV
ncbi:MAG: glycerate kinase [Alphaproteobacteria bacterium]|jgi:hydroxypyruvate reductase|nr:glycerate kinase [Alphaproteobacteria bacterium]